MGSYLNEDFLLNSTFGKRLYHEYAKDLPIIDYHCHLDPEQIANNYQFKDLTELWLGRDHYKWRIMRANGIPEKFITGKTESFIKFKKYMQSLVHCIGNPLYHWSTMELQFYFDIDLVFNEKNIQKIWDQCQKNLESTPITPKFCFEKSKVEIICTTDDPSDDLKSHYKIQADSSYKTKVYPTFRPDRALDINNLSYIEWIHKLEKVTNEQINSFAKLCEILQQRMDFFESLGCKLSDHALDPIPSYYGTAARADHAFQEVKYGHTVSNADKLCYKSQLLLFLGQEYAKRQWTMQLHIGALRNNNSRMYSMLGPDSGYDCMSDQSIAGPLISILNALEQSNELPRTILYPLNPRDIPLLVSIIGSFQNGKIPGKIQLGSAWWHNDHKPGIEFQLTTLANQGVLGRFIGMLTDSRSFLSYPRHDYFRRILCNLIGTWVDQGEYPADIDMVGTIIQNICYYNALDYFRFKT